MGKEQSVTTDQMLQEQMRYGIARARAGDLNSANAAFERVLKLEPDYEKALIWKAAVAADPQESVRCLEQVLRISPANQRARAGLEWARRRARGEAQPENPPAIAATDSQPAIPPGLARQPELADFGSSGLSSAYDEEQFDLQYKAQIESLAEATARELARLSGVAPDYDAPAAPSADKPETKEQSAPYKKHRTAGEFQTGAVASASYGPEGGPADSSIFKAAGPKVAFTITGGARNRRPVQPRNYVALRWPYLTFGAALGLSLLTFALNPLAPVLGVLAVLTTLFGIYLFNRAQF